MRHKRPFRQSPSAPFWAPPPPGGESERIEETAGAPDLERVPVSLRGISRAGNGDPARAGNVRSAVVLDDEDDGILHRVGGHRRIRRELVAIGIGAAFVVAMLAKPWGAVPAASAQATATPRTRVVAIAQNADPVNSDRTIPGYAPLPERVPVDWDALATHDSHLGWGIGTAILSADEIASGRLSPSMQWRAVVPGSAEARPVNVRDRTEVFALAVTFPWSVTARHITFEYLGATQLSGIPDGTIPPQGPLVAVPLDALRPATPADADGTPVSGMYWLAPLQLTPDAKNTIAAASRQVPWPWPLGDYRIRVDTGTTTVTLHIRLESAS